MKKEKMAKKFEEYGKKVLKKTATYYANVACPLVVYQPKMKKLKNIMFNFVLILIFSTIVFSLKAEAKITPSFKSKTYTAYTNEKIRIKIKTHQRNQKQNGVSIKN